MRFLRASFLRKVLGSDSIETSWALPNILFLFLYSLYKCKYFSTSSTSPTTKASVIILLTVYTTPSCILQSFIPTLITIQLAAMHNSISTNRATSSLFLNCLKNNAGRGYEQMKTETRIVTVVPISMRLGKKTTKKSLMKEMYQRYFWAGSMGSRVSLLRSQRILITSQRMGQAEQMIRTMMAKENSPLSYLGPRQMNMVLKQTRPMKTHLMNPLKNPYTLNSLHVTPWVLLRIRVPTMASVMTGSKHKEKVRMGPTKLRQVMPWCLCSYAKKLGKPMIHECLVDSIGPQENGYIKLKKQLSWKKSKTCIFYLKKMQWGTTRMRLMMVKVSPTLQKWSSGLGTLCTKCVKRAMMRSTIE